MIKKLLPAFAALLIVIFYSSCRVIDNGCGFALDPAIKAPDSEIVRLDKFITDNGITGFTKHSSGLYYKITNPGTGNFPDQCNLVGVTYTGKLTNGTVFDASATTLFLSLKDLILGWRVGLPLIKSGGSIQLYIPPDFGYGNKASGSIPANSILYFDVSLNAVK